MSLHFLYQYPIRHIWCECILTTTQQAKFHIFHNFVIHKLVKFTTTSAALQTWSAFAMRW